MVYALLIVLVVALVVGLWPLRAGGLVSRPRAGDSYDEAVRRYTVKADSGSLLLGLGDRTPRAYVRIHGLTNSPLQWLELARMLHSRGHNVLILRLPYHGLRSSRVSELRRLRPEDLRAYADAAVDIGAGLGDEVVVAGISGGATIAAWVAVSRSDVDRALLLAPFFGINGMSARANTLLMNLFARLPNLNFYHRFELHRAWAYRGQSSRGVAAFLRLARQVRQAAEGGIVPTGTIAVITTATDDTANNAITAGLLDNWRGAGVPVITYEFGPDQLIAHNSVDPAADEGKRRAVHDRILTLLGERGS